MRQLDKFDVCSEVSIMFFFYEDVKMMENRLHHFSYFFARYLAHTCNNSNDTNVLILKSAIGLGCIIR